MRTRTAKRILHERDHLRERLAHARGALNARQADVDSAEGRLLSIHHEASDNYELSTSLRKKIAELEGQALLAERQGATIESRQVEAAGVLLELRAALNSALAHFEKQQARLSEVENEAVEAEVRVQKTAAFVQETSGDSTPGAPTPAVAAEDPGRKLLAEVFSRPVRAGGGIGRYLAQSDKARKSKFFSSRRK